MGFVEKEIVIVEVHGIHPVLAREEADMLGGALWRLDLFAPAEHRDHAAEIATVGTTDGRLIDARTAPEDRRAQVLTDFDLVVRRRGKLVRPSPPAFGPNVMRAVGQAENEPRDAHWIALAGDDVEKFEERLLPLSAHQPVDIGSIEHRLGI